MNRKKLYAALTAAATFATSFASMPQFMLPRSHTTASMSAMTDGTEPMRLTISFP